VGTWLLVETYESADIVKRVHPVAKEDACQKEK
jgi:hypothetical protein